VNCKNVQNLLSAFLDCELSGNEMIRVQRHIDTCECCRQEQEELLQLKDFLTTTPMMEPPADFEERLCSAIFTPKETETAKWVGSWSFVSGIAMITAAMTLLVVNHMHTVQTASAETRPDRVVATELQRDQTLGGSDPFSDSTPAVMPTNYDGK